MYNLAKVAPFPRCYHYIIIISPTLSASNTRRMAIANGTCVSFCNQPKAHFGLHWVASGTIAVNVTWMKKRIQCLSKYRSMYPSIFNRFPVIQPVSSKDRHFSTFLHILASWVRPWDNVTWMERGFNGGQTHSSMYPSIFNRLRTIARYWSEIATFSYPHCI